MTPTSVAMRVAILAGALAWAQTGTGCHPILWEQAGRVPGTSSKVCEGRGSGTATTRQQARAVALAAARGALSECVFAHTSALQAALVAAMRRRDCGTAAEEGIRGTARAAAQRAAGRAAVDGEKARDQGGRWTVKVDLAIPVLEGAAGVVDAVWGDRQARACLRDTPVFREAVRKVAGYETARDRLYGTARRGVRRR